MSRKNILKPHSQQEGVVYLRALRIPLKNVTQEDYVPGPDYFLPTRSGKGVAVSYDDSMKAARTITSVKVETAVENMEYIKRCLDEGLDVTIWSAVYGDNGESANSTGQWWIVTRNFPGTGHRKDPVGVGSPTLCEAYGRYHQAVKRYND